MRLSGRIAFYIPEAVKVAMLLRSAVRGAEFASCYWLRNKWDAPSCHMVCMGTLGTRRIADLHPACLSISDELDLILVWNAKHARSPSPEHHN